MPIRGALEQGAGSMGVYGEHSQSELQFSLPKSDSSKSKNIVRHILHTATVQLSQIEDESSQHEFCKAVFVFCILCVIDTEIAELAHTATRRHTLDLQTATRRHMRQ